MNIESTEMNERHLVSTVAQALRELGFRVATEIANLYRSADIAALDPKGDVWVVECKISNIGRAIEQSKTHKLSAEKVFIGTPLRVTRDSTLRRIRDAGIGLIYVMPDGSIRKAFDEPTTNDVWQPANQRLRQRIVEAAE
jgi:hypothetical protein